MTEHLIWANILSFLSGSECAGGRRRRHCPPFFPVVNGLVLVSSSSCWSCWRCPGMPFLSWSRSQLVFVLLPAPRIRRSGTTPTMGGYKASACIEHFCRYELTAPQPRPPPMITGSPAVAERPLANDAAITKATASVCAADLEICGCILTAPQHNEHEAHDLAHAE